MRSFLFAVMLLLLAGQAAAAGLPYDENADAEQAVTAALEEAASQHKNVLMIFGANWCSACRQLDRSIRDGTTHIDANRYITVKIDVGHFDRNMDIVQTYGNPIKRGIPAVSVVTPDSQILYSGSPENFLMPYRLLSKIATASGAFFATMLIAWAGIMALRRRNPVYGRQQITNQRLARIR